MLSVAHNRWRSVPSGIGWFGRSIRVQAMLAISVMLLVAAFVAGTMAVLNGRQSVDVEIEASMDFAEGYIQELVRRIAAEHGLADLDSIVSHEVAHLRHARVYVQDADSPPRLLRASKHSAEPSPLNDTPDWFERLMMPAGGNDHSRIIPVPNGKRVVILKGDPDDEIAEKWNEFSGLAVVAVISIFVLVAVFYFVLGWILNPLAALARGLVALEAGERSQRLDIPRVEDVADISRKFNSLAASLDQTRAENGELYRQIQSVQEDERREVARELHDEAGPCLFGITVSAESVKTLTKNLPSGDGRKIDKRIDEILSVTDRLKLMNRALLKRLHPVSIGKVPLTALIKDLIYDFERRHPEIEIVSKFGSFVRVYGEKVDLTVYRSAQEALTNAIRHGQATSITVELDEEVRHDTSTADESGLLISLRVSDDGVGLKPGVRAGFGLSAMRERVLSADGSLVIEALKPHGTAVSVKIPARPNEPKRPFVSEPTRITS